MLDVGGSYAYRLRGEAHAWTPESVAKLQHAVRGNLPDDYKALRFGSMSGLPAQASGISIITAWASE